jgi:hypothetical protein
MDLDTPENKILQGGKMNEHKIDFAKRKGKSDEWYTPENAIYPILKHLKPNSKIWCPFDKEESNFVKMLKKEGHDVKSTHIDEGEDFFKLEPMKNCDYIISNPPYSVRNEILKRMFSFKIPFMLLMNTNGIFDSKVRWELFSENNFTLLYLSGRVNYMKEYGVEEKSSPPFQSAYICSGVFKEKIKFETRNK